MTHRVFVYGTLKKGFWNNPLLKGCEFFGSAVTVPTYSMISVSHAVITMFPVIRPSENGKPVAGEIYTVDDEVLERLDRLEGVHKGMYSRELMTSPCLWRTASGCGARRSSMLRVLTVGRNTSTACRRTAGSMNAANWIGDRTDCTNLSCDDGSDGCMNPEG
jgi:gamma-glutamylcyclotransferase (GGCT)/AIG2-like uncharacterized protein YtfP